jgi:hypothetical protein
LKRLPEDPGFLFLGLSDSHQFSIFGSLQPDKDILSPQLCKNEVCYSWF